MQSSINASLSPCTTAQIPIIEDYDRMIASSPAPTLELPQSPSPLALQAAKGAASNQHGLINIIRLVKSLEAKFLSDADDDYAEDYVVKRDWETILYARALLNALKDGNEQSSTTSSSLSQLDKELSRVESAFRARLSSPAPTPSLNPALIALPMTPNPSQPHSASTKDSRTPASGPSVPSSPPPTLPTERKNVEKLVDRDTRVGVRNRRSKVDEYLAQRSKGDLGDGADDLLPLKSVSGLRGGANGQGVRDRLLDGAGPGSGIGSTQLHEELGGQLADMSHRLKLNAVHFASSLENEKSLLENSQEVLEKNLASTRSSKKQLSSVSRKGRGTTCLTLGVVVLVMVLFIWTYMLIRFT